MSTEVEETLKRLVQHKAVIGTIVVNCEGIPIKSTLDNHTTTQYSGLINQLVDQAKVIFNPSYLVLCIARILPLNGTLSNVQTFLNFRQCSKKLTHPTILHLCG